jgi:hypothetical protein
MPTIASSYVPPPKSWDEFEDIVLSAAKLRWQEPAFSRGQKQDGVDVYGCDSENRLICIQCKNTVSGCSIAVINEEVSKAEAFAPNIHQLFIATTAKRDADLQREVRLLSEGRVSAGRFSVFVLFWEDVCSDIAQSDEVFFSHYPQFRNGSTPRHAHDKALYDEMLKLLKRDGVIGFLDKNNMAGFSFSRSSFDPLFAFVHDWNLPEREYLSKDLDSLRRSLLEKVSEYVTLLERETFPVGASADRCGVPQEWELERPEHFWAVVNQLHSLAEDIVQLHEKFVRAGKEILIS